MQGKEASEQETLNCTVGIDVSKTWLDAHALPSSASLRVANAAEGIRKLKRWLLRHKPKLVAVEATGKWHRELCRSLQASQIAVAITDPYRVRMFAKAQGNFAKTDRLDAKVLAQFAAVMAPACRAPTPQALEMLKELVTARCSAVAEETALKPYNAAVATRTEKKRLESEKQARRCAAEWKADQQLDHIARYLEREYEFDGGYIERRREAERLRPLIREALIDELLENPDMSCDEIRATIEDQIDDDI